MTKKTIKKYTPNIKEKYMCTKHKKFFTKKLISWRKEIIKSNNNNVILNSFNDTATTEIYTLSLHDALPIFNCFFHHVLKRGSI